MTWSGNDLLENIKNEYLEIFQESQRDKGVENAEDLKVSIYL